MNISIFDFFKIGIGPSSSHTVGPMYASKQFLFNCMEKFPLEKITSLKVELFGSLALTGKGHGTDKAVLMGLEGNEPASVDIEQIPARLDRIHKTKTLSLMNEHSISFEEKNSLIFNHDDILPHHSNGLRFKVFDTDGNIQMDGNLTVAGTTTTVDTVTMQAANAVVFEGATADAYESTLTIVDPTADHTIRLPNQSGWLPVLAAVSATAITSTPEELNIMDGGTSASSTTLDAADRLVVNDAGTMKQVALSDLEVFMEGALDTMGAQFTSATGLAAVGTIGTGVWNGTVVASAYLDADTAHLSTTQTFSGAKTFSAAAQFSNTITVGADDQGYDVILYGDTASANMTWDTSADDLILNGGAGLIVPVGQFTLGATAVSSTATELNYLDGFADAAYDQTADSVVFYDATDSKLKSESANDFTTAIAGNGLASSSGALAISWGSQRFTKALVDATSGTGSGDAANKVAITSAQLSGSEMVFLNGMLLTAEETTTDSSDDNDYDITAAGVITFQTDVVDLMDADDVISVQYIVK